MVNSSYHPLPIVFSKAKGSAIQDPEGNKYLDFLSAYSAVNQVNEHTILCTFPSLANKINKYIKEEYRRNRR